jgi:hypothetical protein
MARRRRPIALPVVMPLPARLQVRPPSVERWTPLLLSATYATLGVVGWKITSLPLPERTFRQVAPPSVVRYTPPAAFVPSAWQKPSPLTSSVCAFVGWIAMLPM